jgi:hypothetical protein
MKSLKDFKTSELKGMNVVGSWNGIYNTPGGNFQGMEYESDTFADDNNDGKWGPGESMILHHTRMPTIQQG